MAVVKEWPHANIVKWLSQAQGTINVASFTAWPQAPMACRADIPWGLMTASGGSEAHSALLDPPAIA